MTARIPRQAVLIRVARNWRRLVIPVVAAAVLVTAGRFAVARWGTWEQLIEPLGRAAPLVYLALWLVLVPCGFPAAALGLTAGAVFGPGPGSGWAALGLMLSGLVMYALGRSLLRPRVAAFVAGRPRLASLNRTASGHAVRLHLLARLSPLNYALVCYTLAAGGAGLRTYVPGLAGALPGLVAYVWLGSAARQGAGVADRVGWAHVVIPVVGGLGLLALGVVLAGYARKAWRSPDDEAGVRD